MTRAKVAVVIVNWNGMQDTLSVLADLERQSYRDRIEIVVDNASSDGSPAAIRERFPHVEVIETGENLGFARGNNVGILAALARPEVGSVLLLNNDTESAPSLIADLALALDANPDAAAAGPAICYFGERDTVWSAGGVIRFREAVTRESRRGLSAALLPSEVESVEYLTTCCLLVRREAFETLGPLDPDYFINVDDADFCWRARQASQRILLVPKARLWHKVAVSTGGTYTTMRTYHSGRSNAIFVRKHGNWLQTASFFAWAAVALVGAFLRELPRGNAQAVASKARGYRDGWRATLRVPRGKRPTLP